MIRGGSAPPGYEPEFNTDCLSKGVRFGFDYDKYFSVIGQLTPAWRI